jgi:hypothetical protein
MGSIKDFKKEINYIFGEVIDEALFKKITKPEVEDDKIEAIIDEAVQAYDDFKEKINQGRQAENKKEYYKLLRKEYEEAVNALIDKINTL